MAWRNTSSNAGTPTNNGANTPARLFFAQNEKPSKNNVFGIGGTEEKPNPYKTQPQEDFSTFTQETSQNIVQGVNQAFSGITVPNLFPNGDKNDCGWFGEKCADNGTAPHECDFGCLITGRGCDCGCTNLEPCTTCDSSVCKECNAWDIQCEDCMKKSGTCTPPVTNPANDCGWFGEKCWFPEFPDLSWLKYVGLAIAIGVLLWLIRPIFKIGANLTK